MLRANLQKNQQRHHESEGVENARDEERLHVARDKLLRGLFAGENAVHVLCDVFEGVDEHNGLRLVHKALETHVLRGVSRVYIGVYSSFAAYFRLLQRGLYPAVQKMVISTPLYSNAEGEEHRRLLVSCLSIRKYEDRAIQVIIIQALE